MPGVVEAPTVKVNVEDPPVVTLVGPKPAATPAGSPVAASEIVSGLPDAIAVEIDVVPAFPATTETLPGEDEIVKSLGGGGADPPTATESNVTVPSLEALCDVDASPTSIVLDMVSVTLDPGTAVQVDPSGEVYAVKTLPARATLR